MQVQAIKTSKIRASKQTIEQVLDTAILDLAEGTVVAVTSKIIALCEGRVVPIEGADKEELIRQEADQFLAADLNKYGFHFSIKKGTLVAAAGIDESNAEDNYVLWPADPQASANQIREYLAKRFNVQNVGVVIVDSVTVPLRWGTMGTAIAFSGFSALRDYVGTPDLFGRLLKVSRAGIAQGLAATAVLMMGEGKEQTPIVIFTDLPFVEFQPRNPTAEELAALNIDPDDDLFAPFIKNAPWQKGEGGKKL